MHPSWVKQLLFNLEANLKRGTSHQKCGKCSILPINFHSIHFDLAREHTPIGKPRKRSSQSKRGSHCQTSLNRMYKTHWPIILALSRQKVTGLDVQRFLRIDSKSWLLFMYLVENTRNQQRFWHFFARYLNDWSWTTLSRWPSADSLINNMGSWAEQKKTVIM